ncbi:Sulfatase-modifying factor 1 [Nostocoides japonicum T1-X7]|uniref:Sulfatase-modifying factor 1 n=2 Tax=Nostocoides japonicum TaxID=99481 RepID=A0A077LT18_9MICO|nr:Sulfatase-modifying factor 1 [Tetrasphaera japonica T1-X7]
MQRPTPGMVGLPGAAFLMGSNAFYPEEGPVHERHVEAFEIDVHPVTNEQFARFVEETGYLTTAERPLDPRQFPDLTADELTPGALAFTPSSGPVDLGDWRQWWRWQPGASWRHPQGPGSGIEEKADHPVVQVSYADATAYATWVGKSLPTEEELEYAARGGLEGATYAWGEDARPGGRLMANTWQGRFPYDNRGADGWVGTSPVGSFPANGYGLVDLIGNVWEWTTSDYTLRHEERVRHCCAPTAPRSRYADPQGRRVLKGGSHLCAPEYCLRYRPAARSPQSEDTSTTHIGFRCVRRPGRTERSTGT